MLNRIFNIARLSTVSFNNIDLKPWIVCLSAFCFFFYEFTQLNILNALSDHLIKEFDLSSTEFGNLSSTYFIMDIIFLIPAGMILDRITARKVIIFAMTVCTTSTLLFALSKSYWMLCVSHGMAGFGNACCFLSCVILIKQWFPEHLHSLLVGVLVIFGMLGGIVSQLPMELAADLYGWRSAVLFNFGVGIIIFVVILCNVFDKKKPKTNFDATGYLNTNPWKKLSYTFSSVSNWFLGLYTGFVELPMTVFCTTWGKMFLQETYFVSNNITEITSMLLYGTMLGAPSLGWYVDKQPDKRKLIMVISSVISILLLIILLYCSTLLPVQMLYFIFFGIGYFSSIRVLVFPLVTEINPTNLKAQSLGFVSVLVLMNGAIVHPLIGLLLDLISIEGTSNRPFVYVLSFIPVVMFCGVLLLICTKGVNTVAKSKMECET